ncbi:unnamed protein product, partial [Prorocentrum cordatum]
PWTEPPLPGQARASAPRAMAAGGPEWAAPGWGPQLAQSAPPDEGTLFVDGGVSWGAQACRKSPRPAGAEGAPSPPPRRVEGAPCDGTGESRSEPCREPAPGGSGSGGEEALELLWACRRVHAEHQRAAGEQFDRLEALLAGREARRGIVPAKYRSTQALQPAISLEDSRSGSMWPRVELSELRAALEVICQERGIAAGSCAATFECSPLVLPGVREPAPLLPDADLGISRADYNLTAINDAKGGCSEFLTFAFPRFLSIFQVELTSVAPVLICSLFVDDPRRAALSTAMDRLTHGTRSQEGVDVGKRLFWSEPAKQLISRVDFECGEDAVEYIRMRTGSVVSVEDPCKGLQPMCKVASSATFGGWKSISGSARLRTPPPPRLSFTSAHGERSSGLLARGQTFRPSNSGMSTS